MINNYFMSNFVRTFNTIARSSKSVLGGHDVWLRVDDTYMGGGVIDTSDMSVGDVIKAGTMVHFKGPGKAVDIIKAEDVENLSKVNGLVWNDVVIPEGVELATCAVVRKGRIYADRADIPASVESQLPMIEFVREV